MARKPGNLTFGGFMAWHAGRAALGKPSRAVPLNRVNQRGFVSPYKPSPPGSDTSYIMPHMRAFGPPRTPVATKRR